MKEMKFVNRGQKVRDLGLKEESLRGNICQQLPWVGWGREGAEGGKEDQNPPTLLLSLLKRKLV